MADSTARSDTESEEESDREPNGVAGVEEESQGAIGSSGTNWIGVEQGGGRMSDQPRYTMGRKHGREVQSSKKPKLRGTESSALIAAVLG